MGRMRIRWQMATGFLGSAACPCKIVSARISRKKVGRDCRSQRHRGDNISLNWTGLNFDTTSDIVLENALRPSIIYFAMGLPPRLLPESCAAWRPRGARTYPLKEPVVGSSQISAYGSRAVRTTTEY